MSNRMFLVHIPTGLAVFLGSRQEMGWGWHGGTRNLPIQKFYEVLEDMLETMDYKSAQDDFSIAMENASETSTAIDGWKYGKKRDDGLFQLIMPE